ncbi:YcxB family protein [Bariatricus sp. SGI.154]|uniref:YcxB family protein n=1 Tax=Bariatricus sp. SGI.154 TaxID=3420549 RepID=UPI003D01F750
MKAQYTMNYIETKEVLADTLKLYGVSRLSKNYRIIVSFAGVFAIGMYIYYGKPFGGNPTENILIVMKMLLLWLAAYVVGEVFARTAGKWLELTSATGDAEQLYKLKMNKNGKPLKVRVEFFEDHFTNYASNKSQEYRYADAIKLIESKDTIGIVVHLDDGKKPFFGFPKAGLENADIEEFKRFLEDKCPGAKEGFQKMTYKA